MVEEDEQMGVRPEMIIASQPDQVARISGVTADSLRDDVMYFPTLGDGFSVEVEEPLDGRMLVDGSDVTKGDEGVVAWKERPNFSSAILCGDVVTRGHDHIVLRLYIRWSNRVSCCPGYGKIWDQTNASTTEDSGTMICFASREIRHFFVRSSRLTVGSRITVLSNNVLRCMYSTRIHRYSSTLYSTVRKRYSTVQYSSSIMFCKTR